MRSHVPASLGFPFDFARVRETDPKLGARTGGSNPSISRIRAAAAAGERPSYRERSKPIEYLHSDFRRVRSVQGFEPRSGPWLNAPAASRFSPKQSLLALCISLRRSASPVN